MTVCREFYIHEQAVIEPAPNQAPPHKAMAKAPVLLFFFSWAFLCSLAILTRNGPEPSPRQDLCLPGNTREFTIREVFLVFDHNFLGCGSYDLGIWQDFSPMSPLPSYTY